MATSATGEWSREQILFMIQVVKRRPTFYNPKHPEYHKRNLRRELILEMTREMQAVRPGTTEEQFNKKFKSLKAQLYTAKRGGKSGDAAGKAPLWCLQELLFLDDHMGSRTTVSNIPVCTAHSSIEDEDDDIVNDYLVNICDGEDGEITLYAEEPNIVFEFEDASTQSAKSSSGAPSTSPETVNKDPVVPAPSTSTEPVNKESPAPSTSVETTASTTKDIKKKTVREERREGRDKLLSLISDANSILRESSNKENVRPALGALVDETYQNLRYSRAKRFKRNILKCCMDAEAEEDEDEEEEE